VILVQFRTRLRVGNPAILILHTRPGFRCVKAVVVRPYPITWLAT
jgi:hypothetical protein